MGSNPSIGSKVLDRDNAAVNKNIGKIPEWPNGADCKSAGFYLRWFESITSHYKVPIGVAKPTATVREGRLGSLRFGEVTGGCLVGEGSSVKGLPLCRR